MPTHVKICCISSLDEARLAIRYGASALGLVGHMPSGPGVISDKLIREIVRIVPPGVASFLLTSETTTDGIIAHHQKVQTNTIQIVDELAKGHYADLRHAMPSVKLVQVIHVLDEASVRQAESVAPFVDAILLDSGNPNLQVKELGGTGRTHNWTLSRNIRETVDVPIFLAGGLHPGNIREAIATVQPFGVDLCSGVRTDGRLNEEKLAAFMKNVNVVF